MKKKNLFLFSLITFFAMFLFFCGRNEIQQPKEKILAKIGEKTISENEFIRRAEFTIRPQYCNGENYIHRKIILNSLIAEKLFALEANNKNPLSQNDEFLDYLRGRKEQAMRQWLYSNDFYNKVELDSAELNRSYKYANRTYNVSYYTMKDSSIVNVVNEKLNQGSTFSEVFRELGGLEAIPKREVDWSNPEHEIIRDALFSEPLKKKQIVGPLKIDDNFYTLIQVDGWTDQLLISEKDVRDKYNDVSNKLRKKYANTEYSKFVKKVMSEKKVQFHEDAFFEMVNFLGPFYMQSENEKKEMFNQKFWHKESDEPILDELTNDISYIKNSPFFTIDGKIWTVSDFERELNAHPLVFRKRRMKKSEFAEQFKLAVVDMIQDKFIAEEAYKKGYDEVNVVKRNSNMWHDYLTALYQKNQILQSINKSEEFYSNHLTVIEENLNPYVDSLQQKYHGIIEINTDLFEQIQLTNIDMMVLQKNVPFPIIVPSFPILTTDNMLDYGQKMMEH